MYSQSIYGKQNYEKFEYFDNSLSNNKIKDKSLVIMNKRFFFLLFGRRQET